MGDDDYRPRDFDHLIEPMISGLGGRDPRLDRPLELQPGLRRWWRRLVRLLHRLFRR
jgi:hypothetical protein